MRVLIADDEPLARDLLRALLADVAGAEVVGEAADGVEAAAQAQALRPDLIFLDIDMPRRTGLDAAAALAEAGATAEIIFVTAHEEHAIEAFELGALDYVLKPVSRPRLLRTMERARLRHDARGHSAKPAPTPDVPPATDADDGLWVPVRHGLARVAFADVTRVEAARDHVYLHTAGRAYLHRITMAQLERMLAHSGLLRVHRSAFVRPERVVGIRRHGKAMTVVLDDGTSVPVGSSYRAAALAAVRSTGA